MNMTYLLIVLAVIYLILNILVSIFLARRDDLDSSQKGFQIVLVWLFPFVGAIGLWQFNKSQDVPVKPHSEFGGGYQDSSNAGSDGSD